MADLGLFADPALLQREQLLQEAKMSPQETINYMALKGGKQLGQGIGSLFGVNTQDPMMKRATLVRGLAQKYGVDTAEGLDSIAQGLQQAGDFEAAMQIKSKADALRTSSATLAKTQAEAAKAQNALSLDEKLRNELSKLSPDASEEDIMKVVTKYGSADKVLATLQAAQAKKADREQRASLQTERLAQQAQIERDRIQSRQDLALLMNSIKQSQSQGKPLTAADLKEINKIKSNVDTANNTISQADNYIGLIDEGKMQFGAGENALGVVRRLAGKANESDLNKVEFEQFVTSSVNSILNLAKGPQTDQDAKRAEKQIIDALNKNDSSAVKRGLQNLKKVWKDAKDTDMSALELYSSERQGKSFTPSTEIPKSSSQVPKATKRFNPATGQIESL